MVQMWSTIKMKLNCHDRLDQVRFVTKTRQENDVTNCISLLYTETKTKLSRLSDRMWSMVKTRQDNDMSDSRGSIDAENDNELLWLIVSGVVCDKNQTEQWCDWPYKHGICQKRNWTFMTDRTDYCL